MQVRPKYHELWACWSIDWYVHLENELMKLYPTLNTDNFIKERSMIQKYLGNQSEHLSRVKSKSKKWQEENDVLTNGY